MGLCKQHLVYVMARRQESIGIAPLVKDGTLHTDSTDKANILQFQSVFTPDDGAEIPHLEGYPSIPELNCDNI